MQQGKGQSAYMKIFLEIADDIANGIYKVGDVIPTQLELASAYQVSRVTVREAIKELTRRGVVATQKGKGTVVIGNLFRAVDYQRVEGFSKVDAPEEGPQPRPESRLVENRLVPATEAVSRHLKVPPGTMLRKIERVRSLNGMIHSIECAYLLNSEVSGVDFEHADMEKGSLYELLRREAGIVFDYITEQFKAILCPEREAELLGVKRDEPVLYIRRVTCAGDRGPIEYVDIHSRSDLFYATIHSQRLPTRAAHTAPRINDKPLSCLVGSVLGGLADAPGAPLAEGADPAGAWKRYYGALGEDPAAFERASGVLRTACFAARRFSGRAPGEAYLQREAEYGEAAMPFVVYSALAGLSAGARADLSELARSLPDNWRGTPLMPAGCAIAAACARAASGAGTAEALHAGLEAARLAESGAPESPSVAARIEYALSAAGRLPDPGQLERELAGLIGNGPSAAEAVPFAFGLAACGDLPGLLRRTVFAKRPSASAPAAGCLAGLFGGLALFPEGCLADLDALSGCPLEQLAEETAAR